MSGEQAGVMTPQDAEQQSADAMPAWFDNTPEPMVLPATDGTEQPPPILVEDDEEQAAIDDAKAAAGTAELDAQHYLKLPEPRQDRRPPSWAKIPPAPFRFPRGLDVAFVRIRAKLTAAQQKGDRILIVWPLTDADERLAYQRANGDTNRAVSELARQTIRAIDGVPVDWSGKPGAGNIDALWRELGGKGRGQMIRLYTQMHVFDRAEQEDFFENCVELVSTG